MKSLLRHTILLVVGLALTCAAWAQTAIKPGDVLRLICAEESTLNNDYRVTNDGLILVDFLGAVKVAGLTTKEAAEKVSKQLIDEKILRKATVSVAFVKADAKFVKFSGAIGLAAETPWRQGMRLADVIALAEPDPKTDLSKITVRSLSGKTTLVDFTNASAKEDERNPLLAAGDEVIFAARQAATKDPDPTAGGQNSSSTQNPPTGVGTQDPTQAKKVRIQGAVVLPGEFDFERGMTVRDLLLRSGGFVSTAEPGTLTLERAGLKRSLKLPEEAGTELLGGDVLTVGTKSGPAISVTILGAVVQPGKVEISDGLKLTDAIRAAGGFAEGARPDKIVIISPNEPKPTVINYEDIELGYKGDLIMKPGQTVQVSGKALTASDKKVKAAGIAAILILLFG